MQEPLQEKLENDAMAAMTGEVFSEVKRYPSHILFYRDGVGEGMFDWIRDNELPSLQDKLKQIYKAQNLRSPLLTFVVVQKRHHLRAVDDRSYDNNPPPGTVIEDAMVIDAGPDNFYMYSHRALQGTARPTHYQIIFNENNQFNKRQLAEFTYAQAHLHQGCTKSVSLPACVYYADLACYLTGTSFRDKAAQVVRNIKHSTYFV